MRKWTSFIVSALVVFTTALSAYADHIILRVPSYSNGTHAYYHELLRTVFSRAGYTTTLEVVTDYPHLRERHMLDTGELSLLWLFRTPERDRRFIPIPVPLTNGLMGKRILLVNPKEAEAYKGVSDIGQFRRLGKVGGFGLRWHDTSIWDANFLPYRTVADWQLIYRWLAEEAPEVDYFSRGFTEIVQEAKAHPELAIEPHLMFSFQRDFIFYLSPKDVHLKPILEKGLRDARNTGLLDALVRKHWATNFERLKPERRTVIKLKLPE